MPPTRSTLGSGFVGAILAASSGSVLPPLLALRHIHRDLGIETLVGIYLFSLLGSLALMLKASLLPAEAGVADPLGDGALYVILFYAGLSLVLGAYEAGMKRMKWGPLYAERVAKKEPA